jgi:hypothetical protein
MLKRKSEINKVLSTSVDPTLSHHLKGRNMKNILALLVVCMWTIVVCGQEVKHYDFKVKFIIVQKKIDVKGVINLDLNNQDSITFTIWKNTVIKSITIAGKCVNFSFDTTAKSPIYYIPDGGKLIIRNMAKNTDEFQSISSTLATWKMLQGGQNHLLRNGLNWDITQSGILYTV